ncbi:DUF3291 domain-containing protein [Actinocorallia longicatena]|uniref:DUF3291 domain-containing protein n=1 Tax=Actinocorallia longicatena TaxID=111803 RepID=A0ABP6PXF4_9ACTN
MHLAQLNIGRLSAPLDSPLSAGFADALEEINALADGAPGFVWRLVGEGGGDATSVRPYDDPDVLVNMSVWESRETLFDYVYRSAHMEYVRRRREWFQHLGEVISVLWWVPEGHVPTVAEAKERLEHLRAHGPSPEAFTFRKAFEPREAAT